MKQDNESYNRVDKAWGRMSVMLDDKMPQNKRRYALIIWLFCLSGIILAIGLKYSELGGNLNGKSKVETTGPGSTSKEFTPQLANLQSSENQRSISKNETEIDDRSNSVITNSTSENINKLNSKTGFENKGKKITTKQVIGKSHSTSKNRDQNISKSKSPNKLNKNVVLATPLKPNVQDDGINVLPKAEAEGKLSEELMPVNKSKPELIDDTSSHNEPFTYLPSLNQKVIYSISPLAFNLPEISPLDKRIIKKEIHSQWIVSAGVLAEYIPEFNSSGFGFGLQLEKRLSPSWGIGLAMDYIWNTRQLSADRTFLEIDGASEEDVPSALGNQIDLDTETALSVLKENTDILNSIGLEVFVSYYPISRLGLQAGLGVERYSSQLYIIENQPDLENNLNASSSYSLGTHARNLSFVSGSLTYALNVHFKLFAGYRLALTDLYNNNTSSVKTSKITTGLLYSF